MPTPPKLLTVLVACAALGFGCRSVQSPGSRGELERSLQSLLENLVATNATVPGAALHVEMARLGLSWTGACGVADRANKAPLDPQQPVRIASNTKTFVAAAILRLREQGLIELDRPISEYLPNGLLQIMQREGYEPEIITVRHLLTHTSGLFDYADSKEFIDRCRANVHHRWTRAEQLQGAMDWGNPYGAPGEVFRYSDTGYILLGEMLERVTGLPMAEALRQLIGYETLGLDSTWLETLEPKPSGVPDRAHQYEGDFDTYSMDPSADLYGGGGLVSTVRDLAQFMQCVFTGRVYVNSASVDTMLSTVPVRSPDDPALGVPPPPNEYRMGVEVIAIDGVCVYWHTGYWGTMAAYVPSLNLAIGATVNQQEGNRYLCSSILRSVLTLARAADARE